MSTVLQGRNAGILSVPFAGNEGAVSDSQNGRLKVEIYE